VARQLFIVGPGRSGTTAMMRYLNDHPRVLVLKERYKFVPEQVAPEFFTEERVLARDATETNSDGAAEDQRNLSEKDLSKLRWFGDKVPVFVRHMPALARNNPGSRFVVMYRQLEEVAASYAARAANQQDVWLGGKDGVGIAIRDWNAAYHAARQFVRQRPRRVLMIDHAMLSEPDALARKVGPFLNVRFGERILEGWEKRSRQFAARHHPFPLDAEDLRRIREGEDPEVGEWARKTLAR
jgi:hypothetical protein